MTRRRSWTPLQRARVFDTHGGVCHICGERIDGTRERWELEHILPIGIGGEDAEDNVAPAHLDCHKDKTAEDKGQMAKANRVRAKHIGAAGVSKTPLPGGRKSRWKRKVNGSWVERE